MTTPPEGDERRATASVRRRHGRVAGIGAAAAREMATAGYDVAIIFHSDEAAAASVLSDIVARGATGRTYRTDLGNPQQKLGPLLPVIDVILLADRLAPAKQQHSAKRIFERLRDEHGFGGGYTVVKDYVRICRVEGQVKFSRANFMLPIPIVARFEELDAVLEARCRARQRDHRRVVGDRHGSAAPAASGTEIARHPRC